MNGIESKTRVLSGANNYFKKQLKCNKAELDMNLKSLYYDYLLSIIHLSDNKYDKDTLNVLKEYCKRKISYENFYDLCSKSLSKQFKTIMKKNERKFCRKAKRLLIEKNNIDSLLSFYTNRHQFFNSFDILEYYINKYSVDNKSSGMQKFSGLEIAGIISFYFNCAIDYLLNTDLKKSENEETKRYLIKNKRFINDYDIKTYLSELETLSKKCKHYSLEQIVRYISNIGLNIDETQIRMIVYFNVFSINSLNYSEFIEDKEKNINNEVNSDFEEAKQQLLSIPEVEVLNKAEIIIKEAYGKNLTYYKIANIYTKIKSKLIKFINASNREPSALNVEVEELINDIEELSQLLDLYRSQGFYRALNKKSN